MKKGITLLIFSCIVILLLCIIIPFYFIPNKTQIGSWNTFTYTDYLRCKKANIPIIIYFTAEWCPHCVSFENKVLSKYSNNYTFNDYILFKVDRTDTKNIYTKSITYYFKVKHIPTIIIINNNENQKVLLKDKDLNFFKQLLNLGE